MKYLNLIEFIKKINEEQMTCNDYQFFMYGYELDYELEPVYKTSVNEVVDFIIKEDGESILNEFSLTELAAAKYEIKERDE